MTSFGYCAGRGVAHVHIIILMALRSGRSDELLEKMRGEDGGVRGRRRGSKGEDGGAGGGRVGR